MGGEDVLAFVRSTKCNFSSKRKLALALVQRLVLVLYSTCTVVYVPLIRPLFCTLHPAQRGEGAYFEYAISLDYTPPQNVLLRL